MEPAPRVRARKLALRRARLEGLLRDSPSPRAPLLVLLLRESNSRTLRRMSRCCRRETRSFSAPGAIRKTRFEIGADILLSPTDPPSDARD